MMTNTPKSTNDAIERLAAPICAAHGVELVEVRTLPRPGGAVFQVTIDREQPQDSLASGSGVSLDDCTAVSRDLSDCLDAHEEHLPANYRLEVSSPGVERPLVRLKDYERFCGKEVRVRTLAPVEGRRNFEGILVGVSSTDGDAVVGVEDGTEQVQIPLSIIAKAHLLYRF